MKMFVKNLYKFLHPGFQKIFLEYRVDFKPRYGYGSPPHSKLYEIINQNRERYEYFLNKALSLKDNIWEIKPSENENDNVNPVWNNNFLPGLDIITLYTMLVEIKPKVYLEIGSGNSTKVAYKAKKDHNLKTQIISIDPLPRVEIDKLADKIIRQPLEKIDLKVILDTLNENDILFVDNSHRLLPNSDVTVFFLEILPELKKGIIVHIHDVYLPYDYPQFMCERAYSEQYALAIYLLNSSNYEILLPNYFIYEDKELSQIMLPIWDNANLTNVERHGGSFWFKIK